MVEEGYTMTTEEVEFNNQKKLKYTMKVVE